MKSQKQPRVFHLITRLLKGGAEKVVTSAVIGLDNYKFTVGYGASYDQDQVDLLDRNGIKTKRFPLIRHYNPVTAVPAVIKLAYYFNQHDYDIVHTHSTEAGIIGRLAASIAEIPHIVHTVHGVPFADDRNTLLNQFVLGCERVAARRTDQIATNADVITKKYLQQKIGSPEQYSTIYVGIDLDEFRKASPVQDLPGTRPRVVMIGRLTDGKGFDVMLEAVELLSDVDTTVCLVGDGPRYDSLQEEIIERNLSDSVFLTGYRDDIPQILAASDILVLPSYREGTPLVITEAMAGGLPVVATDIAGIPEQVEHGRSGYLIPTGDSEALAERLKTLLTDPELRERMGANGLERAEKFSVKTMLEELDELYQELLEQQ